MCANRTTWLKEAPSAGNQLFVTSLTRGGCSIPPLPSWQSSRSAYPFFLTVAGQSVSCHSPHFTSKEAVFRAGRLPAVGNREEAVERGPSGHRRHLGAMVLRVGSVGCQRQCVHGACSALRTPEPAPGALRGLREACAGWGLCPGLQPPAACGGGVGGGELREQGREKSGRQEGPGKAGSWLVLSEGADPAEILGRRLLSGVHWSTCFRQYLKLQILEQ